MADIARALTFSIFREGSPVRSLRIDRPIIKIGCLESSHLRLDDPAVERMHAVIEVADEISLIDLGTDRGTFLNGARVDKASLHVGDVIGVGPFEVRLDTVAPVAAAVQAPVAPPSAPTGPACMRCGDALVETWIGLGQHGYREAPIRALQCAGCAITYVDVGALEQKLGRRVRLSGTAVERSRKHVRGACPLCASPIDRVSLEWAGSWATIEECGKCGLLVLEQGELAVVERLVATVRG